VHNIFLDSHANSLEVDGGPTQCEQFVNSQSGTLLDKGHNAVGFWKQVEYLPELLDGEVGRLSAALEATLDQLAIEMPGRAG
jgi:hypothetical protein